ncbi:MULTISPECIES: hydroxyethylthiazole kinase [Eikenella]|uniref:Hydroxyethylthiazole kinase n=1 Tax=Eikenella longinqua TaxID=1795827 RepID=A0A1A9RVT7_9NEIS|nr:MULTISPECIES: hydroxyethylthiazole kinase [Eikenella]OAM26708.1 hydroxyethylthiazole kinase [Eikenella longinqua]
MQIKYLDQVRARNPLVHNITNIVSANFSANGLLAIGASPIMADSVDEMDELAAASSAVVLNIGTLNVHKVEAMLAAGKSANRAGVPVVLDPVGAGFTALRRDTTARLLREIRFAAVRGNAGEMAHIAGVAWQAKGVDAGSGSADLQEIAQRIAQQHGCIAAISGETDYVSDGSRTAKLNNGTPLFPKVTASGCLLSTVVGAFAAVAAPGDMLHAVAEACTVYAVAGELAAQGLQDTQSGSFAVSLIDHLGSISARQAADRARVEWI